jgi:hypothetical protein
MDELLIYEAQDKKVAVRLEGETVWLTQVRWGNCLTPRRKTC